MLPIAGRGAWIWYLEQCDGVPGVLERAQALGLSHVLLKVGDGAGYGTARDPEVFRRQWEGAVGPLHDAGLRVLSWSYVYLDDPAGEAEVALWALRHGADGHVFDVEGESAGKASAAQTLCSNMRTEAPDAFLAYAPLPVISYHQRLPYAQFNQVCNAVLPQFYTKALGTGDDWPFARLFQEWDDWTTRWRAQDIPMPVLAPAIDGYLPGNADSIAQYTEFIGTRGLPGVSVWRLDTLTPEMGQAFQSLRFSEDSSELSAPQQRELLAALDVAWGNLNRVAESIDRLVIAEAEARQALITIKRATGLA